MPLLVNQLPAAVVPPLLGALAELLPQTPHVEHLVGWAKALCVRHGGAVQGGAGGALPALRALQKALTRLHEDLAETCEANLYSLQYLAAAGEDAAGGDDAQQQQQDGQQHDGQQHGGQQQQDRRPGGRPAARQAAGGSSGSSGSELEGSEEESDEMSE